MGWKTLKMLAMPRAKHSSIAITPVLPQKRQYSFHERHAFVYSEARQGPKCPSHSKVNCSTLDDHA